MQELRNLLNKLKLKKKKKKTQADLEKWINYRNQKADSDWRIVFLVLRIVWAIVPLALLIAIAWFTFWLVAGIGYGTLDFKGYEVFLNIVAGNLLVYALGIVYVVMRFLFPQKTADNSNDSQSTNSQPEEEDLFNIPSSRSD